MSEVILPPAMIGIIGGGQLGRMMAIAARQMGYRIGVLEPGPNGPLAQIADLEINAAYDDEHALRQLLDASAVTTYEFENISAETVADLAAHGNLPQGPRPVAITQHRLLEKNAINEAGFETAPYANVPTADSLDSAVAQIGYPAILKTVTGGYDGKGQRVLSAAEDLLQARELVSDSPCILEGFVPFDKEISVIVTRSVTGEIQTFEPVENVHKNGILHLSMVPAVISAEVVAKAEAVARGLMEKLDFIGTLAIEMFVVGDDIVINELAPRPHNSGHLTIDAHNVSQFEQHIRAISGLPLVAPQRIAPSVMVNLLGQHVDYALEQWQKPEYGWGKLHLYGKAENKRDRKVGHLTFVNSDADLLSDTITNFLADFPD
ncbi:MAG: 5-(carboxyamino)imidazole ribonucleotide synthase [Cellulomonadaceae bacterium]|jgi:5-(carboxyamino)imidazole ribonucleotide synthase|nr:5-(carboxyamino)imidazole ribonucleotide synthase [Cellulomonadaceae bacterium]